ncbi:MAG: cysteine desulfurase [Clostridiales bacterium]|nr:cysteine desulfurase [Clostridiales bacterium]
MIYFDNSATTPCLKKAAEIASEYMTEKYFNPAAAYAASVQTERDVSAARANIASLLQAEPSEVFFTSCGTESNNTALMGSLAAMHGRGRVIVSAVEHPSVYEAAIELRERGWDVQFAPVDMTGKVLLPELASLLTPDTRLVSIMHVNNESGAVNAIDDIYALMKRNVPGALLHVDGVQAFMKEAPVRCDMYSVSGHKLHAPKGVGALLVRKPVRVKPYLMGGGQESGMRSGTTNVPGIMAFSAAVSDFAEHREEYLDAMRGVKLRLYSNLSRIRDVRLNGPEPDKGAPHILNMSFMGVRGEVLLNALSEKGLYVSTGSACAAHKRGKNRILNAMGITGDRQDGAIRFSFSHFNTVQEADLAAQLIEEQVSLLRRFRRR